MKACPFWSTTEENFNCYDECPMIEQHSQEEADEVSCIFRDSETINGINFKDILKEDYGFLKLSVYDNKKNSNANY